MVVMVIIVVVVSELTTEMWQELRVEGWSYLGKVENMDISHIVCSSRAEQERHQDLGLFRARAGALLILPGLISPLLCLKCYHSRQIQPTSSLGGLGGGSQCRLNRQLDFSSLRFPFRAGLDVLNEESKSSTPTRNIGCCGAGKGSVPEIKT